jgi:hypothetical protein
MTPAQLYDSDVKPEVQKLCAIAMMMSTGGTEFLESGWTRQWSSSGAAGLARILMDVVAALNSFEDEISEELRPAA